MVNNKVYARQIVAKTSFWGLPRAWADRKQWRVVPIIALVSREFASQICAHEHAHFRWAESPSEEAHELGDSSLYGHVMSADHTSVYELT